eukprot:PRCOL_00003852-RA
MSRAEEKRAADRWKHHENPMHEAARAGDVEGVRALLSLAARDMTNEKFGKAGAWAAANARTEGGATPLHAAAARGKAGAIRELLRAGAMADISDGCGWRPLHFAALANHEGAIRALLEEGGADKGTQASARARARMARRCWSAGERITRA